MVLPEVPGIVEASMTISPEPDGRISFRVLMGTGPGSSSIGDLIELIISPDDISQALAGAKIAAPAGGQTAYEPPTFACHIGLYRNAVDAPGAIASGPADVQHSHGGTLRR